MIPAIVDMTQTRIVIVVPIFQQNIFQHRINELCEKREDSVSLSKRLMNTGINRVSLDIWKSYEFEGKKSKNLAGADSTVRTGGNMAL